jgi:hypothetical protein
MTPLRKTGKMYSADMDSEFGLDGDNIKRDAKKK